jgi:hypothetical protein
VSPEPCGHTHPASTFDDEHDDWQHVEVRQEKMSRQPGSKLQLWSSASQQFSGCGSTSPEHVVDHTPPTHVCVPSLQVPTFSVPLGPS